MTRIKCAKIQYGESFVLPIEKSEEDKIDSPEKIKLKEELFLLEQEIEQAKQQKQNIIDEGNKEAQTLIEKANAQIEVQQREFEAKVEEEQKQLEAEAMKIKQEAYQTGYDDGYKQGYNIITNELEQKVIAVDTFAKSQFGLKNSIIKSSELDIINLVIEIAKKVCTKSIELNPDIIRVITLNAIKALKDKEEIKIIVNPQLTEIINTVSEKLKEEIPQLKTIKIIEENNVSADGTIVESLLTRVDSRVVSQINEIADKLMDGYNNEDTDNYMHLADTDSIEDFTEIKLSDDANIMDFLNELEDVSTLEDKVRDEDAEYYENINLEDLKDEIEMQTNTESSIEDINIDNFDEFGLDEIENIDIENEMSEIEKMLMPKEDIPVESVAVPATQESITALENSEILESSEVPETIESSEDLKTFMTDNDNVSDDLSSVENTQALQVSENTEILSDDTESFDIPENAEIPEALDISDIKADILEEPKDVQ